MEESIKIKISLLHPLILEKEYLTEINQAFNKLIVDLKTNKLTITLDDKTYLFKKKLRREGSNKFRYYKTLILELTLNLAEMYLDQEICDNSNEKVELTPEQANLFKRKVIETELEKYVMDLTFATNLAYPGLFEYQDAKIYLNNKLINKLDTTLIDWNCSYINYLKNEWPIIHILNIEQVWTWLNNRTNFLEGMSKTDIDRALNALTYTLGNTSYETIFYILMGIEAIYNDNANNGITEQIRVKTEALLKRPEKFKKRISKIYDNRSKFIHGKLNFPTKYCPYDAKEDFEDFYFNKYIETIEDAISILISTIQEYIIRDASTIEVSVVVNLTN